MDEASGTPDNRPGGPGPAPGWAVPGVPGGHNPPDLPDPPAEPRPAG